MIEPIGSNENANSPYDRYSQYQQYQKPASYGAAQGPLAGQSSGLAPSQAVQAAQSAQKGGVLQNGSAGKPGAAGNTAAAGDRECQTCKNRKYQDGSDDPGVSYQTPTTISADRAASAVRSHEYEHVRREQSAAKREGREVVSQSVALKTAICPECGKAYVSGGTTTTVTRGKDNEDSLPVAQASPPGGAFLDKKV